MAVSWFTERMNQEVIDSEAEHKRQLREEYLNKFLEACDAQTGWSAQGSEVLLKLIKR